MTWDHGLRQAKAWKSHAVMLTVLTHFEHMLCSAVSWVHDEASSLCLHVGAGDVGGPNADGDARLPLQVPLSPAGQQISNTGKHKSLPERQGCNQESLQPHM